MQPDEVADAFQPNVLDHSVEDPHHDSLVFAIGQLQDRVYLVPPIVDLPGNHVQQHIGDQVLEDSGGSLKHVQVNLQELPMADLGVLEFEDLHGELLVRVNGRHGDFLPRMHTDVSKVVFDCRPHNDPNIFICLLQPLQVVLDYFSNVVQDVHLPGVRLVCGDVAGAEFAHGLQELFESYRV